MQWGEIPTSVETFKCAIITQETNLVGKHVNDTFVKIPSGFGTLWGWPCLEENNLVSKQRDAFRDGSINPHAMMADEGPTVARGQVSKRTSSRADSCRTETQIQKTGQSRFGPFSRLNYSWRYPGGRRCLPEGGPLGPLIGGPNKMFDDWGIRSTRDLLIC